MCGWTGSFTPAGNTSPRQTAAIWGRSLGCAIAEASGLAPNDDPMIWVERVAAQRRRRASRCSSDAFPNFPSPRLASLLVTPAAPRAAWSATDLADSLDSSAQTPAGS